MFRQIKKKFLLNLDELYFTFLPSYIKCLLAVSKLSADNFKYVADSQSFTPHFFLQKYSKIIKKT